MDQIEFTYVRLLGKPASCERDVSLDEGPAVKQKYTDENQVADRSELRFIE
ncbi:hypothetical protein GCM10010911_17390 [Paenibacillus nasutitermitis]|uniref:Uncharacterized protein n=1 Tax=Paenibacillus nasutitermitis TaxID=1652958 RepID=A0A917DRH1_9BACL|nr:hypothetical protein GCM10010911_17390 [Paenibacillus nasutitermitis]